MNDLDAKTFDAFARRFAAIEEAIPSPPPLDGPPKASSTVWGGLSWAGLVAILLVAFVAILATTAGGRPVRSPGPSVPAVAVESAASFEPSPTPQLSLNVASVSPPSPSMSTGRPVWQIAVINGPRPIIVQVATRNAVVAGWRLAPNEQRVLFAGPEPQGGYIDIVGVPESVDSCKVLIHATFEPGSWTLLLRGPAEGAGYRLTLQPGVSLSGPPSTDFYFGCSG
jgi:hypothetical protein